MAKKATKKTEQVKKIAAPIAKKGEAIIISREDFMAECKENIVLGRSYKYKDMNVTIVYAGEKLKLLVD